MKIALGIRRDAKRLIGGDYLQVKSTAVELRQLGHEVDICFGKLRRYDYDIVHLFNLTRCSDTLSMAQEAIRHGIPYVVTPIWHSLLHMERFYRTSYRLPVRFPIQKYLALKELMYDYPAISSRTIESLLRWRRTIRWIISNSVSVLVNSPEEMETLRLEMKIEKNYVIIPNGVNIVQRQCPKETETKVILCPGRIEPRKNTLSVIEGFRESGLSGQGYQLHIMGQLNLRHARYTNKVLAAVDHESIKYVGSVSYEEAQVRYCEAEIVILASFFETTGLVGLEALQQQTNVIMTDKTYHEFYFQDYVTYCDPYSVGSIASALLKARLKKCAVKDDYFVYFSWKNVARLCSDVYQQALSNDLTGSSEKMPRGLA
jgi:glycosyltransferase involved in cell wall biosynthesis